MSDQSDWLIQITNTLNGQMMELAKITAGHSMALKLLGAGLLLLGTGLITLGIKVFVE